MDNKWRVISCASCRNGMYWSYTYDEPEECRNCGGSGQIYIRPKGHCFQYPGGPATGMWSAEKYQEGTPVMPYDFHAWANTEDEVDHFPVDRIGNYLPTQIIVCTCGLSMTIAEHDVHVKKMEQEWIGEHK
jgi:hypothetical protein